MEENGTAAPAEAALAAAEWLAATRPETAELIAGRPRDPERYSGVGKRGQQRRLASATCAPRFF